jgi:hypothetical protein
MKFIGMANYGLSAMFLLFASCATEPSTTGSTEQDLARGPSTLDPPDLQQLPTAPAVVAGAITPGAKQVGYYDMLFGVGQSYQVGSIVAAGATPVLVDDPGAGELGDLNVLMVTNPDNFGFGSGYVNRLADIAAAVQNGMILVIHDRAVTGAEGILPNGAGFSITREPTADINIRDNSTVVTSGLTDASLDGGGFSSHGFALDSSLPAKAKLMLTGTTPSHIVTFCYGVGKGAVIYSTIPLDFYLSGGPPLADVLSNVYTPHVVQYALAGACATRGPRPTPNFTTAE